MSNNGRLTYWDNRAGDWRLTRAGQWVLWGIVAAVVLWTAGLILLGVYLIV